MCLLLKWAAYVWAHSIWIYLLESYSVTTHGFLLHFELEIGDLSTCQSMKAQFSSVQFSCSVVYDSLQPHES